MTNYDDCGGRGTFVPRQMIGLASVWSSFLLRIYTRVFVLKAPYWDDYVLGIAVVAYTALSSLVPSQVAHGLGCHTIRVSPPDLIVWLKLYFVTQIMYLLCLWAIKTSICIFLLRLRLPRIYNRILHANMIVVTLFTLFYIFWIAFQCKPVQFQWDKSIEGGHCIPNTIYISSLYALRAINAVTDIITAVLPAVALFRLKNLGLDTRARIGVSLTLAIGSGAVLATLVSFAYVKDYANREDITYTIIPISITSVVELWLGIVCACLATMRPLLRDISRRVRGIKTAYSDSSYQKYGSSRNETCPPSRDDLLERDTDIGAGGGYAINTTDSIADTERNYSDGSGKTLGKSRNGSGNDNMRDHIREEGGKGTVVELRDIELPRRAVG